jgi:hypothetical protein
VKSVRRKATRSETAFDFNAGKTRIDQDSGLPVGDIDGVALAAAGQYADGQFDSRFRDGGIGRGLI